MAEFLSTEWVRELHDAAQAAQATQATRVEEAPAAPPAELHLVVEQRIDGDHAHPAVVYHLTFDRGAVAVRPGPAPAPTVTFGQDRSTARAIATGAASAQRAFMTGDLRVGGDLQVFLAAQHVLGTLGDVFAEVRARTDFGPEPA